MNTFQSLMVSFTAPAEQFMQSAASNLSSYQRAPMLAALTLYVMWFGISILIGKLQEPLNEALSRTIKIGIVVTLRSTTATTIITSATFPSVTCRPRSRTPSQVRRCRVQRRSTRC